VSGVELSTVFEQLKDEGEYLGGEGEGEERGGDRVVGMQSHGSIAAVAEFSSGGRVMGRYRGYVDYYHSTSL
jgi:hypothetical protein